MPLRALIFDHVWLKMFSLVLATLIWLAVWTNLRNEPIFKDDLRTFVNRPIGVLVDSPERAQVSVIPERATVTVRGPGNLLLGLKEDDINVFVRVPSKLPLSGDLPVHVYVPAGTAVAVVTPITATIRTALKTAPVPFP
jgi:YbbR domain-containing protein